MCVYECASVRVHAVRGRLGSPGIAASLFTPHFSDVCSLVVLVYAHNSCPWILHGLMPGPFKNMAEI